MHTTRTPATVRALIDLLRSPNTARTAALLGGIVAATLPVTAEGQTLSNGNVVVNVAEPITLTVPNLQLANPTLTLNPAALQPIPLGNIRTIPTLSPGTNRATGSPSPAPSIGSAGLGRLVTPERQAAGVVVGRIGSTGAPAIPSLTVDFDGDGLINFEIAPGIVEIPKESAGSGGDALGGLVGQHITMATGTADRVLDGVINVTGVTPATTFEIANGTVVLGGYQPQDVTGAVDIAIPDGRTAHDPKGDEGRDAASRTRPQGDDVVTQGPVVVDPVDGGAGRPGETCLDHVCAGGGPLEPKPGDDAPNLDDIFDFTGLRRPPTPEPALSIGAEDYLDVSIMLPLRNREREGDQVSNHGNEEIW